MSAAGWIKIHRGIIRDGWYQSLTDLQKLAWFNLLVTVNWQPSEFGCKNCGEIMELPAGATGKSIQTLAATFKQGAHVVRGMLDKAVRNGTVTRRVKPRCHSVYVVVNWEKYQDVDIALTQPRHSLDTALTQSSHGTVRTARRRRRCLTAGTCPRRGAWWTDTCGTAIPGYPTTRTYSAFCPNEAPSTSSKSRVKNYRRT